MNESHEPPIRVVIADDEPHARSTLRMLLAGDSEVELVGEHATGDDALATFERTAPELLFLDVQMPRSGGFDVVRALGESRRAEVVFVTAYDEFALRAFEVRALDYLLKPFDDERFRRALERAKERVRVARALDPSRPSFPIARPSAIERIAIRSTGSVHYVEARDIDYVEAQDYYVMVHSAGASHLLRESMKELAERLPPSFVRIHRSTIVNAARVRTLRTLTHGECLVVLGDGTELRVSRGRREQLEAALRAAAP